MDFPTKDDIEWTDPLVPGSYFETWVDASSFVTSEDGQTYAGSGACASSYHFTIDADGGWTDDSYIGGCVDGATFTIDARKMTRAALVAEIPVTGCQEWDPDTGECTDEVDGTISVDLIWAGTGPMLRNHGTSSGGTAGYYQYTSHGTGTQRQGDPSGTITFNGGSLISDATYSDGWLWQYRSGSVDVSICRPGTGC